MHEPPPTTIPNHYTPPTNPNLNCKTAQAHLNPPPPPTTTPTTTPKNKQPQVEAMAKKLAMHVVAAGPQFLSPEAVPAEVQTREKDVARQTVREMWWGVCVCGGGGGDYHLYLYLYLGWGRRNAIVCVDGCGP